MIRTLLVLRHAHAEATSEGGDFKRELTDKGKRNAQRMGIWLARQGLVPDYVRSSPAVRAKRSAQKCVKTIGLRSDIVVQDERLYVGGVDDILDLARNIDASAKCALLVGHAPTLKEFVSRIARAGESPDENDPAMKPGTLVRLQTDAPWAECDAHSADVHTLVRPKRLPETFPYPQLDSSERRIRPAYYYRQSSVVPWRERDGELQVLVMGSSKAKHWVIPKGIHDPGFSAQESAAHEAFEEAGVGGTVLDRIMTTYSYPKWDATCEVAVYAMHVTRELADDEWQERHRGRRWLPVAEAAELVLNEDVGRAIRQLPAHLQATT